MNDAIADRRRHLEQALSRVMLLAEVDRPLQECQLCAWLNESW
jgi:hypothetical protein